MSVPQNQRVLGRLAQWLKGGRNAWLCTIVETWGSSPRPEGSWLAVCADGEWAGSVSGGCIEQALLQRCVRQPLAHAVLVDYGITSDDVEQFQLPCGGRIRLLIEPLTPEMGLPHVRELLACLESRTPVQREVFLDGRPPQLNRQQAADQAVKVSASSVVHPLLPECRLLLIGAGEVSRYVADFAATADFDVTLCEPRSEFARGWRHDKFTPEAKLPDDLIREAFSDSWSGVLALAHDPRIDDMALIQALQSDCFYVGAMGSRRTSDARRQRLRELGVSRDRLSRLRAPIGLDIPSKTPVEIAISVIADLIQARYRLRQQPSAL